MVSSNLSEEYYAEGRVIGTSSTLGEENTNFKTHPFYSYWCQPSDAGGSDTYIPLFCLNHVDGHQCNHIPF
jgi:hypothetical protein